MIIQPKPMEFGDAGLPISHKGMKELARQLTLSLTNPVWEQVRKPAPWSVAASNTTAHATAKGGAQ